MNLVKAILGVIFIMSNSIVNASEEERFSFLFLGDLHYRSPKYETSKIINDICEDLKKKNYKIDFVCNIGDLIENQENSRPVSLETGAAEWEFAIKDIKKNFKIPFFMSLGNHDWYGDNNWFGGYKNIEKYYYPFMAKELGTPLRGKPFFSFRWKNSYFLFLNHMGYDTGFDKEQKIWLEKSLTYAENNDAIEHVFLFSHPNLWNVTYFRFNENFDLLPIVSKFKKVDAYFCGHTHHNNATVWNFGRNRKILQINGSPDGHRNNPLRPIGESELILNPPPSERGYAKGYKELYSYFVVSIQGNKVDVSLERIGGEKVWEFGWTEPGKIKEKLFKTEAVAKAIEKSQLKEIKEARLHIYPYVPERILPDAKPIEVIVNGEKAGILPRAAGTWYLSKPDNFIKIPAKPLNLRNEIRITNPNRELFALRDIYLEIILNNGKVFQTPVYPYVVVSGEWRQMYMDFGLSHPTAGVLYSSMEANVSEELIQCGSTDKDLAFSLSFEEK